MKITEHNATTGEVIERDLTPAEVKQHEADLARADEKAAGSQAKADAKAALLERLGITADEAALLLG
jgi:hypothetical protein